MRTHYCCQTNRNSPQKTEWSTLSSMMQHSSVSNLWIWVMFFPRTLQCRHNSSGLCCAVCYSVFSVFQQLSHISQNSRTLHEFIGLKCLCAPNSYAVYRFSQQKKTYVKDAVAIQINQSMGPIMKAIPAQCRFNDNTYRPSVTGKIWSNLMLIRTRFCSFWAQQ